MLVEGEIRHAGRALADAHGVGVGGHANHRHRDGRPLRFTDGSSPLEDDVASDRLAVREELSRRDLAQQDDRRPAARVTTVEGASAEDADAERVEDAGRARHERDLRAGRRVDRRQRRAECGREAGRQSRRDGHGRDTRARGHLPDGVLGHVAGAVFVVALRSEVDLGESEPLEVHPGIDLALAPHFAGVESGQRDEQD